MLYNLVFLKFCDYNFWMDKGILKFYQYNSILTQRARSNLDIRRGSSNNETRNVEVDLTNRTWELDLINSKNRNLKKHYFQITCTGRPTVNLKKIKPHPHSAFTQSIISTLTREDCYMYPITVYASLRLITLRTGPPPLKILTCDLFLSFIVIFEMKYLVRRKY